MGFEDDVVSAKWDTLKATLDKDRDGKVSKQGVHVCVCARARVWPRAASKPILHSLSRVDTCAPYPSPRVPTVCTSSAGAVRDQAGCDCSNEAPRKVADNIVLYLN